MIKLGITVDCEKKQDFLCKIMRERGHFFENAKPDMFRAIEKRLTGKTRSKVDSVMRTVNM